MAKHLALRSTLMYELTNYVITNGEVPSTGQFTDYLNKRELSHDPIDLRKVLGTYEDHTRSMGVRTNG